MLGGNEECMANVKYQMVVFYRIYDRFAVTPKAIAKELDGCYMDAALEKTEIRP